MWIMPSYNFATIYTSVTETLSSPWILSSVDLVMYRESMAFVSDCLEVQPILYLHWGKTTY